MILLAVLLFMSFVFQTLVGLLGGGSGLLPPLLLLPWILVPPLLKANRRYFYLSFAIGLGWDLCFEVIIGPGMIAWSLSAALIWWLLSKLGSRALWVWSGLGAASSALFWFTRALSLYLVGLPSGMTLPGMLFSALSTGGVTFLVGFVFKMDIPERWRRHRMRKLR